MGFGAGSKMGLEVKEGQKGLSILIYIPLFVVSGSGVQTSALVSECLDQGRRDISGISKLFLIGGPEECLNQ